MPEDISRYYTDLTDDDLVTRLALVHQRFSTNFLQGIGSTVQIHVSQWRNKYPSWKCKRAREELMQSDVFGDDIKISL
jgi:glutamate synthase (ferredoxin)